MDKPLSGKVALVAGATRGAGRGIAIELATAGAIVYATGRSSRSDTSSRRRAGDARTGESAEAASAHGSSASTHEQASRPFDLTRRPETIEETAELVAAAGGIAHSVRVDHSKPAEVRALCDRIAREHGQLDILVNDIWGGDDLAQWGKPFWEQDLNRGFELLERATHTHLITNRHALPLLLKGGNGLIVEVTDGDGHYYRSNAFYDLAKSTVSRIAFMLAEELRETSIVAVAVTPGFLRSEAMLDHFGVTELTWRDAIKQDPNFEFSETPRYVGRAIAALAADPDLRQKSGRGFSSWQLQMRYGFSDIDNRQPHWGKHAANTEFGKAQIESDKRWRTMFDETRSDAI